jgi:phosphoglycerate dehydrogenase-like enzyme
VYGAAHPLLKMDNVVATPHLGYDEQSTYEMYSDPVAEVDTQGLGNPPAARVEDEK